MKRIVNVFVVLFLMAVSVNQVSAQEAQKGKEAGKPIPSEVKNIQSLQATTK